MTTTRNEAPPVRYISVGRQVGAVRLAARQVVVWSPMVIVEGASHAWFGGSWVIDVIVLVMFFMMLATNKILKAGLGVDVTKQQLRDWIADGMPDDLAGWKRAEEARPVGTTITTRNYRQEHIHDD